MNVNAGPTRRSRKRRLNDRFGSTDVVQALWKFAGKFYPLLILLIELNYHERESSTSLFAMAIMVPCETNEDCAVALRVGSECIVEKGYCSNPFHKEGCLSSMITDGNDIRRRVRVCSSLDPIDSNHSVYCVENKVWNYNEIRLYGNNWESIFFETWIVQILLSEMLGVPTSVETGFANMSVDFYDYEGRMDYGTGYDWDVLRVAANHSNCEEVTTKVEEIGQYKPCAYASLEVWEGQLQNMKILNEENITEKTSSLGVLGNDGFYIPKFTAEIYPEFLSYLGLAGEENRRKLADTFLRPTTWHEYCTEVSNTSCDVPDEVATRPPSNDGESSLMFMDDIYTGYFRKTYENDCDQYPHNCTGNIVDYPCGWSSFLQQQTFWLNISLRSSGSEPVCRGYPYSQMVEIWKAANATKSHVMMYYWTPNLLVQQFVGTDAEFQKVSLPLPTQECFDHRVSTLDRCQDNITRRIGSPLGACDEQAQILMKAITNKLYDITHYQSNEALNSPAYDAIKNFQITSLQLGVIFSKWLHSDNESVTDNGLLVNHASPSVSNPREAVCEWVIENYDLLRSFVPKSYPRTIESAESIQQQPIFIVAMFIGSIVMLYVIAVTGAIWKYRDKPAIKVAQVEFLLLVASGLLLIQLGSLVLSLPQSNGTCHAAVWLVNIGYTLELVPLAVKIAALNRLMAAARQLKRLKISRRHLFGMVLLFTIIIACYLTVWTIIDPFNVMAGYVLTERQNQYQETVVVKYRSCQSVESYWVTIALFWRALLLLWATILAFQTRNSPVNYNESRTLAFMIYSQFLFLLWTVVLFVLRDSITLSDVLLYQSLIYSLDVATVCSIYFVPKIFSTAQYDFNNLSSKSLMASRRGLFPVDASASSLDMRKRNVHESNTSAVTIERQPSSCEMMPQRKPIITRGNNRLTLNVIADGSGHDVEDHILRRKSDCKTSNANGSGSADTANCQEQQHDVAFQDNNGDFDESTSDGVTFIWPLDAPSRKPFQERSAVDDDMIGVNKKQGPEVEMHGLQLMERLRHLGSTRNDVDDNDADNDQDFDHDAANQKMNQQAESQRPGNSLKLSLFSPDIKAFDIINEDDGHKRLLSCMIEYTNDEGKRAVINIQDFLPSMNLD